VYTSVVEIIDDMKRSHSKLVEDFVNIRNKELSLTEKIKEIILEVLHVRKLPDKCNLY